MVETARPPTTAEQPPEPPSETPPPDDEGRKRRRRAVKLVIALLAGFVVYAFAFSATNVRLDEIQSETRRVQLFRILRALAKPDLITYDTEDQIISVPFFVPCPATPPVPPAPSGEGPTITVNPACAAPGDTVTITGSGFEPEETVALEFVPRSEFAITLPIGRVAAGPDGTIVAEYEVPDRVADEPQEIRATVKVPIGSWTNRVEVWTDTNENGTRDPKRLPDAAGTAAAQTLLLPDFPIRSPGGVALVDDTGNARQFLGWGESFEATKGAAAGRTAQAIGVDDPFALDPNQSVRAVGGATLEEATWQGPGPADFGTIDVEELPGGMVPADPFIDELGVADGPAVEVVGPPGESLQGWKLVFYDGDDGTQYKSVVLADQIDLSPRISDNAKDTWDKIVETVMLALLATTVGLILAVPLSFFAARNLMRDIATPLVNLSLTLLALPVGVVVGTEFSRWMRALSAPLSANAAVTLVAAVVIPYLMVRALRAALPEVEEEAPSLTRRAGRAVLLVAVGLALLLELYLISRFFIQSGMAARAALGPLRFLGEFIQKLGEIMEVVIPVLAAIFGAGVLANLAGRFGYLMRSRIPRRVIALIDFPLAAAAWAMVGVGVGAAVEWFGQFRNPTATFWIPAVVGGLYGLFLAARATRRDSVGIGLTIYYIARTVFNALRSVEPLVMVIVFVVWVGIGPFAGALALALHTTAALAKLYSEQVESISHGPIEAIRATGATRMQTIVYAVVPQIVPPYISFTMYRWDINVRMSTIIGFAGGGGIGFLLQQNINLLQYRAAAAQMLAIAIVVATMDYVSSRLRERVV